MSPGSRPESCGDAKVRAEFCGPLGSTENPSQYRKNAIRNDRITLTWGLGDLALLGSAFYLSGQ
jgi:hypothetical protein